jgi:hypothetical protein
MKCYCINAEGDGFGEVSSSKLVTSTVTEKCVECGCDITPGTEYKFERISFDDDYSEYCEYAICLDCYSVREHLFCDFCIEHLWDDVYDSMTYSLDEHPWDGIGKLTPVARQKVCEAIEQVWDDFYLENPTQAAIRLRAKFQKYPYSWKRPDWMNRRLIDMQRIDESLK